MNLASLLLLMVGATASSAVGTGLSGPTNGVLRRQDDVQELYLCSNPDFNDDCENCACESLTNLTMVTTYGGPPCYPLPSDLRVGNPQGVSSARSYSQWNCTLFDNIDCDDTGPDSFFAIPPGPPGSSTLGPFDDRAVAYQCFDLSQE